MHILHRKLLTRGLHVEIIYLKHLPKSYSFTLVLTTSICLTKYKKIPWQLILYINIKRLAEFYFILIKIYFSFWSHI